jgi:hypothetical protein
VRKDSTWSFPVRLMMQHITYDQIGFLAFEILTSSYRLAVGDHFMGLV